LALLVQGLFELIECGLLPKGLARPEPQNKLTDYFIDTTTT